MESYNNEPQMTQTTSYEFSSTEERLIEDLAKKMKFVSYFLIAIGVLQLFSGVLRITIVEGISIIINGIINLAIGLFTYQAATSFALVAKTRGHDIQNLMDGLKQLKKLYGLQYWLLIVAIVIFVIFAMITLFT